MYNGKVVEHGVAGDIFNYPQQEYTKALFAAAPGKDWDFGVLRGAK
jgi:peptide/nickel transport system ATP-binding protein